MKNKVLPWLLFLLPLIGNAQNCPPATAQADLHANNIRARILNGGDLFTDWETGRFQPNPVPGGLSPTTMFAAGFWMGGYNATGDLKMSAVTYRSSNSDGYSAGPLDEVTGQPINCTGWDRVFRVEASEILAALQDNSPNAPSLYPNVYGWPGNGNPYFAAVNGFDLPGSNPILAPYFDANSDGTYNPAQGDYPAVSLQGILPFVPEEICWTVFHTGEGNQTNDPRVPLEVQLTAWAFQCADAPVLNNTVFTSHKIIHRGTQALNNCFVALWVDFDLGCHDNDYIGCDTTLESFFVYNQTVTESSICPGGVPGFGAQVPTQSVTFLNKPLDRFMYYNGSSLAPPPPTTDPDYYNLMTGIWNDGTPLTFGGNGYNSGGPITTHAFPTPPHLNQGWSECLVNLPYNDRRCIGSHQIGAYAPGEYSELTCAWSVHAPPGATCSTGEMTVDVAAIRDYYFSGFSETCMPLTAPETAASAVQLFPNPAAQHTTVKYEGTDVQTIRCYRSDGRLMRTFNAPQPEQTTLDLSGWPPGVYTLDIRTARGSIVRKLIVTP